MWISLVNFSQELANTVERAGTAVISVLEGGRVGVSGTVWREGIGVTVDHTIQGLEEVTVILPSGKETRAKVISRDPGTDIALLKLPSDTPTASLADDSKARAGEIVLSIGRPGTEGVDSAYRLGGRSGWPWGAVPAALGERWGR